MSRRLLIKLSFGLFFAFGFLNLIAQQDLTLYELRSVPQANQINASRMPLSNVYVLLPAVSGAYISVYNEGFNYNDMVEESGDTLKVNMTKGISRMRKLNDFGADVRAVVLGVGFRSGASYITFNVEQKISGRFTYPKTLFEFAWHGSSDPGYINNRISMDGLGLDLMAYAEMSLGWARDINEELSLGFRLKYLNGQANVKTLKSSLGFTPNVDFSQGTYSISVDGAFAYQSAGAAGAFLDSNQSPEDLFQGYTGNHGGALDIGATYRFNNKVSISAAVNDIGMIQWSENVNNGTADTVNFLYDSEDLKEWNQSTVNGEGIKNALDTLFRSIDFVEDQKSYTTWLPTKIYLGVNYRLFQKTDLSLLSYSEFYNSRFKSSIRVAITQRVRNWLMASVNYSFYGRSAANVGLGFSINGGPIQLYAVSDNVISYLLPKQSKNFHLRFGINLTFSNNFSQN